jgi:hypothetical protein
MRILKIIVVLDAYVYVIQQRVVMIIRQLLYDKVILTIFNAFLFIFE